MKNIMVVAAYELSHSGEGDSLPYDSYVVHVVDCDRTDADCVGVHRDNPFWNSFWSHFVNCNAASFVNDLRDLLCAPAALNDPVPAATYLFLADSPSVAADAEN